MALLSSPYLNYIKEKVNTSFLCLLLSYNFILVLVFFLAISVGYALFSETITIEGTATAQGDFDIEVSCDTNVTLEMLENFGFSYDSKEGTVAEQFREHGFKDVTCVVNDDRVYYSVGFEYPRAIKYYVIKMKNTGSIAAYYNINSYNSILNDRYNYYNTIEKYDENNNLIETLVSTDLPDSANYAWIEWYYNAIIFEDVDKNLFNMEEDEYQQHFIYKQNYVRLKPGESVYLLMVSHWDDGPTGTELVENNVKYVAKSTLEFNWEQIVEE